MTATPARRIALQVVTRVREREAFAHETLDAVLRAAHADHRDASFATRLAYGTIACRGTLDEAIARFVTKPSALEPLVTDALALSAYELLFARTPARAAVSEGVELVRSAQPRAAGLANAVLRRLSEAAEEFPWGDVSTDNAALARSVGHPLWLAELWIEELGPDVATAVMHANNEPAPLFLVHLPFASTFESAIDALTLDGAEPVACALPGCIVAKVPSAAIKSHTLDQHVVLVADAAAQFAAHAVRPAPGQTIVELGAGRGTKTFILAGLSREEGNDAAIIAIDNHESKLATLLHVADTLGIEGVSVICADATSLHFSDELLPSSADRVLVDAPCSGLGTLRRHPDRRWRAKPADIEALAGLGERLLAEAAALVKPRGFVVYSTCTIARRENVEVVRDFLASPAGRGFEVDSLGADVPTPWRGFVGPEGFFQSLPQIGGMDGHFVARLVRKS